ncbi:MAG: tetratricopeptide repeat protein [Acidobacteriota bacterium]|nr:tetratricopeptide repeat protein [Acidobacteriota bacterium]
MTPLSGPRTAPLRFGRFEVDLASGQLRERGIRIKLQEQPFQALVALIEFPGEVVTREELQKRIWPANTVVDFDRGLNKAIARLREALGDDAGNPLFIETLPQHGYRFLVPVETAPAEPPPAITSIAVLPLENLSDDPAQEYFCDGMTDELIGEIARVTLLRVISRTSIMQYKEGPRKPLPVIARELSVDAILEGTVVRAGGRVRITAQLIRACDDRHLWSEKYERDLTDILALQSEVARTVAGHLQMELTPVQPTGLTRNRTVNPEAYDAYLKGNFFLHKSLPGVPKSIEYFTEAISLDPLHAAAHAGLAQALISAGIFGLRPSANAFLEARVHALRALDLDETNSGAHNALADVKKGHDWDLAGAVKEYQRAIQLNPSQLLTRLWYAECLTRMGRYDEALAESGRALALDPLSPMSHANRAMLFWRARRYNEAIQASRQALEFDPAMVNALWWQGLAYAGNRDFPQSIACLTKAIGMSDQPLFRALLGYVHGCAGQRDETMNILEEINTLSKERYVSPVNFAIVYAGLGEADSTFLWLEEAYRVRENRVHELSFMYFDSVRSDPRYSDLVRRVGLPA